MSSSIPKEMLAAQVVEYNKPYKVHKVPVPSDLGPHDLLIKVAVASLCHTDFMVAEGLMGTKLPCTGSHEGAGTVVAVGSAAAGFNEGDRVMAGIVYHPCGTCPDCLGPENYSQYCPRSEGLGVSTHGHFAEYARIDSRTTAVLPDRVSLATAAPLACAGITIYRGVVLAGVEKGGWLALTGSGGGLGHLGVQFAKALGLRVIGIDARAAGLELTRASGADVVIDARDGLAAVVKQVRAVTNGQGVPCTLNISDAEDAISTACAITRMHGTVIQIGQPDTVAIPFRELIFRDVRVRGSMTASPQEARDMLQVVAEHGIEVAGNAFHGLEQIGELVRLAESGKMKGKGLIVVDAAQMEREKRVVAGAKLT
ncbi:GroES-like protein [Didymella exigua CBS 183.55]|uniref:GroES-like protein n=1 Tax=Didymella exigua CBS 183.55 TaxID=1150837 RepID=A0A6A5RPA3_9PLEO|nr:GroES-like protein [Didymella exigua CBS 183.55]KAF1929602.1 GroES-like protein [Didymella exigua CBS 183.55]